MRFPRSALQRERLRLLLRIVAFGSAIGALVAGAIGGSEIFLLRGGSTAARWLLGPPFVAVLALKTFAYAAIASLLPAAHLLGIALPGLQQSPTDLHTELLTIGFSLATTFVFVALLQAAGLVGRRTFLELLRGRYRRPRLERRFFLFGDAVNATSRLEQATRELGCPFLVSGEALEALGPLPDLRPRDAGTLALRGREQPMRAWSMQPAV
jgi:adenylate cyclase